MTTQSSNDSYQQARANSGRALRLRDYLTYYLSVSVFGIGALATNAYFWLFSLLPSCKGHEAASRRTIHKLMRLWMWFLDIAGAMKVDWADMHRMDEMKGCIIVANHPNLLDICWILAASPDVVCMFKSEINKNSFLNASARMAGYISNDSGMDGLHLAVDKLQKGAILVVFPEGTRTHTPPLGKLKQGFALIAKLAQAPIQPLYIQSYTKSFTIGAFFSCSPMPIHFKLGFGEQVRPRTTNRRASWQVMWKNSCARTLKPCSISPREYASQGITAKMQNQPAAEGHSDTNTKLFVSHDMAIFEGHFPGNPLVPAALQLEWMLERLPKGCDVHESWTVKNAKFLKPLQPGTEAQILIRESDASTFKASIQSEAGTHSMATFTRNAQ